MPGALCTIYYEYLGVWSRMGENIVLDAGGGYVASSLASVVGTVTFRVACVLVLACSWSCISQKRGGGVEGEA